MNFAIWYVDFKNFDFPRHLMIDKAFNSKIFDPKVYGNHTTLPLKSWIEKAFVKPVQSYIKNYTIYDFGEIEIIFYIVQNDKRLLCSCEYDDFKLTSIRFMKDNTVIKEFRR